MAETALRNSKIKNDFGGLVDYFLFSVRTSASLFALAGALAEHCHCRFSTMENIKITQDEQCPMEPEFRLLYAQFDVDNFIGSYACDPVDRLNILLFQNRAVTFDKTKTRLVNTDYNGTFSFIDDGCECCAFSKKGINVVQCNHDYCGDFYILVFSKKNQGADKLAAHIATLSQGNTFLLRNHTSLLYEPTGTEKKISDFFQLIVRKAEIQIRGIMRNEENFYLGKVLESMTSNTIQVSLSLSPETIIAKSELTINNL